MDPTKESGTAFESETFGRDGSFYIDKPIGSASISPCGRDIVLASREGIHIIDLDSPYAPPRNLTYKTPWEVADVQWSPFAARDYWIVSTSNQKALVWNVGLSNPQSSIEFVLHGHSRAITDINFSAHHPDILATCAVDSYVHCWDLRRPVKPGMSFCDWDAGATQVKWNRQSPHILASSHDQFLRIWDDRWGAQPLRSIKAHSTKIYGVDWDRLDTRQVATCGLDHSIKLWRFDDESDTPARTISTPFPVWRARHTPFGNGLLALPQRGDQNLHLYDQTLESDSLPDGTTPSIYQFTGHRDSVKEFLWRSRGNVTSSVDDREFQLVSWGKDKLLRLHDVNDTVLGEVGYVKGMEVKRTLKFTRRGARYRSFRLQDESLEGDIDNEKTASGRSALTSAIKNARGPIAFGFGAGGFMSATQASRVIAKETDPVSWMKGVKIGKRALSPSGAATGPLPLLPPSPKLTPSWDVFDSLGEEITSALSKFPNLEISEVDVKHRTMTMNMSGPWGDNRRATRLTCRLDFPSGYPNTASPDFTLDNAPRIEEETAQLIRAEVTDISSAFLAEERSCLEDILRYLQGEQTLDEARHRLERPRVLSAFTAGLPIDSSSDEEDNGLEINSGRTLGESDPMIAVNNARYNVPLPNTCGVRWAPSGLLVCFFPPRPEKNISSLGHKLDSDFLARYNTRDMFQGFGNLRRAFRSRGSASTVGTTIEEGSNEDDIEISSGSSSSSTDLALLNHPFLPGAAPIGFESSFLGDKALDISQKSVEESGQGENVSASASVSTTVVISPDHQKLLPMRADLARHLNQEPGYEAARHNARIAKNFSLDVIETMWHLCCLLLASSRASPAEAGVLATEPTPADGTETFKDVAGMQSAMENAIFRDKSFIRTQRWIVDALLSHVRKTLDVQLLVTIINVLDIRLPEPPTPKVVPKQYTVEVDQTTQQLSPEYSRPPLAKPQAFQFPWKEELERYFRTKHQRSTSFDVPRPLHRTSSNVVTLQSPKTFHHTELHAGTNPSTSPEQVSGLRRSNSTVNTSSISFIKNPQISHSASSSPPGTLPQKRSDPAVSIFEAPHSGTGSLPSNSLNGPSLTARSLNTDRPARKPFEGSASKSFAKRTTVKLKNQHRFQQKSVVDPTQRAKYEIWKRAYANQLTAWSLHTEAAEVMNRNRGCGPNVHKKASRITNGDLHSPQRGPQLRDGPSVLRKCPRCEATQQDWDARICNSCRAVQPAVLCSYCRRAIKGGHSPCLSCKHTVHYHCRIDLVKHGINICPSGCGCKCSEHGYVRMPLPAKGTQQQLLRPRVPSRLRDVSSAITVIELRNGDSHPQEPQQAHQDDAAYVSLAKTLEKRRRESSTGLRATASQMWRGGH